LKGLFVIRRISSGPVVRAPLFLALGCVGFLSSPAFATELGLPDEPDTDPQRLGNDIIVNGQRETRPASPKDVAPLLDTPRSVVVIDREVIRQTGSATLVEALRTVPGITFGAAEGGNPIGDRPFIRGFDSQGSTYVDGVRDIGAQSREVFAVEQIEVVRGSDSTLGGRGSAGGTLNIISRLPTARENFISGAVSYGTDDYKRLTFDVNRQLGPMVGVRISGLYHDQDFSERRAVTAERWGVAPSITLGLGTPTRLTAVYYYLHQDELPDSGIPYLYTALNAPLGYSLSEPADRFTALNGVSGQVDRDAFYGLKSRDFRRTNTHQATLRFEHDLTDDITIRNTARYGDSSQAYIYTQPDDNQGNVYNIGEVWRRTNTRYGDTRSLIDQLDLSGRFNTGSIRHSFAAGAELSYERAQRGTFILATGSTISPRCTAATRARFYCTSAFSPNPNAPWVNYASDTSNVQVPIVRGAPIAETINRASTLGFYGFDSITLADAFILNLGLRWDRFRSEVSPGQAATATTRFTLGREDSFFNYQVGLVYKPRPNISLYASYATAATPPNSLLGEGQEFNALPTVDGQAARDLIDSLRVERTRSYELGAKADLLGNRLSLTAAAFQTETRNARVVGPDNTPQFIGERRVRGIELGFNGRVFDGLTVTGGYTFLDADIVDGGFTALTAPAVPGQAAKIVLVPSVATGRQAPQTARHSFTAWANYQVTPKLSLGGGAFYMSRVYGGYADNRAATQNAAGVVTVSPATRIIARSIPSYWRFDARAAYAIDEHIELSVNLQNLTNERYFTQAYQNHYATIAPGRSAFATLSLRY
jgi:catecholate siderophore receptor